jgi:uncharacterized protein YebE (UPF0316 family)
MNQAVLFVLIIVAINVTYVTLQTLRLILLIKGLRVFASLMSVIEVFVYLMGLSIILTNLNSYWNIAAYCLGYGLGVYTGSRMEEKLALGYITAEVIVDSINGNLPQELRKNNFGVTSWIGEGRDGPRLVMTVLAKRNRQKELLEVLDRNCSNAFVVFEEPKYFQGGFWASRLGHR